jgi:CIC family chloride channel protein
MIGGLIAEMISRRINHESFYETVLAQDGQHVERLVPPRSLRTWMELPSARIANFSPEVVTDLEPAALRAFLEGHAHDRFPVVLDGRLAGVLTRKEAVDAMTTSRPPVLEPATTCTPADPVRQVATRIVDSPSGLIVVVGKNGGVNAVITMHDLLRAQMSFASSQQD